MRHRIEHLGGASTQANKKGGAGFAAGGSGGIDIESGCHHLTKLETRLAGQRLLPAHRRCVINWRRL